MTTSNQQQTTGVQPEFGLKRPDQIKIAPPGGEKVPPGQFVAKTFPVLTYGDTPEIDLATWTIRVWGLVEREITLDWPQFCALPQVVMDADFHCVTQWSALDQTWEGVLVSDLLEVGGRSAGCQAHHGPLFRRLHHQRAAGPGPVRRPVGPPAERRRVGQGPRLAPASDHPQPLRVEVGQVGQRHRADGRGRARVSGSSAATTTTPIPGRKSGSGLS